MRSLLAAVVVTIAASAGVQDAASSRQESTQPAAPIVRATPRPKPILLPSQTDDAQESGVPAAKPAEKPAVPKAVVKKVAPAASPAAPAASTAGPAIISPGPFNRTVVVIDPAHGGNDAGARITDSILEKDVDLQLAFKLRSLLTARGFTVVLTRDSDTGVVPNTADTALTLDARAGVANHQRPVACLLLHSTGSGRGVHLYSSELAVTAAEAYAAPWLTAQSAWVGQSVALQKQLGRAMTRAQVPLVMSRASVRPVDSLTCPALVLELAPSGSDVGSLTDDGYQRRVAGAIATALLFWQNAVQPPGRFAPPAPKVVKPVVDATGAAGANATTPAAGGVQP